MDYHQNLIISMLAHDTSFLKISSKSVHKFFSYRTNVIKLFSWVNCKENT